jgi:hypothetical protein
MNALADRDYGLPSSARKEEQPCFGRRVEFLAKTSDKLDHTIKKTRMSKGSRMN